MEQHNCESCLVQKEHKFILDFAQKHPKTPIKRIDVWDCGCTCCEKMRPMYHDVAHQQVCAIIGECNKRYNKLNDEHEILKFEVWSLEENRIKQQERIDELERLLFKKRTLKDI